MQKPTRPAAAYVLFCQDKKFIDNQCTSAQLQAMWKDAQLEERATYVQQYQALLTQYQQQLERYYEQNPEERARDEEEKTMRKQQRHLDKRERQGRLLFAVALIQHYKTQNPELPFSAVVKNMIHAAYNILDEAEKAKWSSLWGDLESERRVRLQQLYDDWENDYVAQEE